jgi:hypothetical protein
VNTKRFFAAVVMTLLIIGFPGSIHGAATRGIEDRIRSALELIKDQSYVSPQLQGFLHATTPAQPGRMYSEDASLVALALSSYQETHYSQEFYPYLKTSADFITRAQTPGGDFYEYYDITKQSWSNGGRLYSWNPYAIVGPAYAAFVITSQVQTERAYWASVINVLRRCVDSSIVSAQGKDGAVVFAFPDGSTRADVAANAALLVGLTYIALFEQNWGDGNLATKYARFAESIAGWLYSFQEKNSSVWGFGGFYSNQSRTLQPSFENGLIMFGLNSYYKAASTLLQDFQPSISDLKQVMIDWMVGFVERQFDSRGGVAYGRTSVGMISYPKTTMVVTWVLQATVDVWINIGPEVYWNDSSRLYEWLTGKNELSIDLQNATSVTGRGGGFYSGIERDGLMKTSDLGVDALALYALVRAAYVSIPGQYPVSSATSTTHTSSAPIQQTTEATTVATRSTQPTAERTPYFQYGLVATVAVALLVGIVAFRARRAAAKLRRRKRPPRITRRRANWSCALATNPGLGSS